MRAYSYLNLLDEDTVNLLMQLRQVGDEYRWGLGDLVNSVIEGSYDPVGVEQDICKAVGAVVGERSKDVRLYKNVSGGFTEKIRKNYDELSWMYFRHSLGADNQEQLLQWSIKQIDELNRPASVDAFLVIAKNSDKMNDGETAVSAARKNSLETAHKQLENVANSIELGKIRMKSTSSENKVKKLLKEVMELLEKEVHTED
jgi:transketolase